MPDRTTGENKMSKLLDLMKKLGSDAALAAEYDKDAERVMQRAGLSDEERRAMVAKDYTAIKKLTGLEDGQFATNHTIKAYDERSEEHTSELQSLMRTSYAVFCLKKKKRKQRKYKRSQQKVKRQYTKTKVAN